VEKEHLTREEAATILGINPKTLDQFIRKKEIAVVKLTRKCVRIPIKNLRSFIKERTV